MVLSMRYLEYRVHPRGVLHWRRIISNPREPGAPCHDGKRGWLADRPSSYYRSQQDD